MDLLDTGSLAAVLDDAAVYRRTAQGQRELLRLGSEPLKLSSKVLARLNGYTDLRRLIDLSPEEASKVGAAVVELLGQGLIERVQP